MGFRDLGQKGSLSVRLLRAAATGMIVVAIFGFGYGAGNGTITFGSTTDTPVGLPEDLNYKDVEKVYDAIKTNYDGKLDSKKLEDGLMHGLAEATGDPYTEYFNVKEAQDFQSGLNGSFSGIGAELGKNDAGNLIVVAPIEGSPASAAGLKSQDIIASIDGKTTQDMSITDAVGKIRGKKDTQVKLQIIRKDAETKELTITRDEITIPSVESSVLNGNVGYIKISQFGEDTVGRAQTAARELKDKKVKGVILDLRGNPGGLVDGAVGVSSLWLPVGKTVLQEKQGGVVTKTYVAEGTDILRGVPTVVLINEGSASASEITAGALKDNGAATLLGEKSYGKGVVQGIFPIDKNGAEIKITVASWYRPNGQNINKKGITPDKTVKISDTDVKNKVDSQKNAALDILK